MPFDERSMRYSVEKGRADACDTGSHEPLIRSSNEEPGSSLRCGCESLGHRFRQLHCAFGQVNAVGDGAALIFDRPRGHSALR
jgi:hypothetical protein